VPFLKTHKGRANSSERARGGRILSSGRGEHNFFPFPTRMGFIFFIFNPVYTEERSLPWRGFVREHSEGPDSHFRIQLMFFLGCCFFFLFLYLERIFVFSLFSSFLFIYIYIFVSFLKHKGLCLPF